MDNEFLVHAFQTDTNIQAIGDGPSGKKVMYVLHKEDAAPYAVRDENLIVIECNGFGIEPPFWPDVETKEIINPKRRHRPAYPGVSVANKDVTAGTLTGYFADANGVIYALSNNHVFANVNRAAIGSAILQPGPADGGNIAGDTIATLTRYGKIENGATIDAAIARVIDIASTVDLNIVQIGYIHGIVEPYPGQKAKKYGRTTELTRGDIVVINASVRVNYGTKEYTIDDCIITGVPSAPGDSGSPVVDFASNELIGVLFAGGVTGDGYGITVLCRASNVMGQLEVAPIPVPKMQKAFWLDLSHWQGDIQSYEDTVGRFKANISGLIANSFSQMVAAGVYGVIIKSAQGKDVIDPNFEDYYNKALAAGLKVATYDFVDPRHSANEHMDNFLRVVMDKEFEFVAMDCEAHSGQSSQTITAVIQQFGSMLHNHYSEIPWIYTAAGFWNQYVLPWSGWANYPLWVAFWSDVAFSPLLPNSWKGVEGAPAMWQFIVSNSGEYLGVESKQVDLNTMYPSGLELIGATEPPPPPDTVRLDITIEGSGFVSPSAGQYPKGSTVQLIATPSAGWSFQGWGGVNGDIVTDNPLNLLMDTDKDISSVFIENEGGLAEFTYYKGRTLVQGQNIRRVPSVVGNTPVGVLSKGMLVRIIEIIEFSPTNKWANLGYDYTRKTDVYAAIEYGGTVFMDLLDVGEE